MSNVMFSGSTYDPQVDQARLTTQLSKVFEVMVDEQWHTIPELVTYAGGSEAGISARIRDFRKVRFGGHMVERRRVAPHRGLYEYRLVLNNEGDCRDT